jgi:hypothetical protein
MRRENGLMGLVTVWVLDGQLLLVSGSSRMYVALTAVIVIGS